MRESDDNAFDISARVCKTFDVGVRQVTPTVSAVVLYMKERLMTE
jgi:hypothetical protein